MAATPKPPRRITTAFFPNLREGMFKDGDTGSADEWGEQLNKMQEKCFNEPGDMEACKQVGEELNKASGLFTELSLSAKATAAGALARIGAPLPDILKNDLLKTADVGPASLVLVSCLAPVRSLPSLRTPPECAQDFF